MDIYIQIGLLLVFLTSLALVAYFYSVAIDQGINVHKALDRESVNYSLDGTITSPTFYVDHRVFTQWAINTESQRSVYLVYPENLEPDPDVYGQYLYQIDVEQEDEDPSHREIEIHPQTPQQDSNAFFMNDQAHKTLDFLYLYSQEAKQSGRDKMITVHTFADPTSSEIIYVCYIRGVI